MGYLWEMMEDVLLRAYNKYGLIESQSYPEFHMPPAPLPSGSAGMLGEGYEYIGVEDIIIILLTEVA